MGIDDRRHHRLAREIHMGSSGWNLELTFSANRREAAVFDMNAESSTAASPSPMSRAPSKTVTAQAVAFLRARKKSAQLSES